MKILVRHNRNSRDQHGPDTFSSTLCRVPVILLILCTLLVLTMEVLIIREVRSPPELQTQNVGDALYYETDSTRSSGNTSSTAHYRFGSDGQLLNVSKQNPDHNKHRTPDGYFNGYPVFYQEVGEDDSPSSQIHCIGETNADPILWRRKNKHVDMTWAARSCHFQFFCFDMDTKEYVIFPDAHSIPAAEKEASSSDYSFESQQTVFTNRTIRGHPYGVAIGGINGKWTHEAYPRLKWFPRVEYNRRPTHFYALPSNVTIIPFHSLAAFNPGHLLWDDFLPLYTLAQVFHLDQSDLLLLRYTLPGDPLWASCDWQTRKEDCDFMLQKFGPLMSQNVNSTPALTQNTVPLQLVREPSRTKTSNSSPNSYTASQLVCARHGLAGLGALTDHGVDKGHGWDPKDYGSVYNQGRGGQLWRFRNFLLHNLGVTVSTEPPGPPYRIIFSEKSSKMSRRSLDFSPQVAALLAAGIGKQTELTNITGVKGDLTLSDVRIESYQMKEFTLKEQVEMVHQAAIYVTGCGGGAVTATFLPRGSSAIIYYSEDGGVANNKATGQPARLDWDYFNNMGYSRVHWFVQKSKDSPDSLNGFVELIRHQLDLMRQQRAIYEATLKGSSV